MRGSTVCCSIMGGQYAAKTVRTGKRILAGHTQRVVFPAEPAATMDP
jgi:hypothetical protein